jgi:hypothetical protein
MIKLSDTQLVILSAACQREGRLVLPLPDRLKGGAAAKVVESLLAKGLVAEVDAERGDPVWRATDDGHWKTLAATDAAFAALGIEHGAGDTEAEAAIVQTAAPTAEAGAETETLGAETTTETPAPEPEAIHASDLAESGQPAMQANADPGPSAPVRRARGDSKQAKLIEMLKSPEGATIDEIAAALGWQAHTVRGAIAGALKKKLGLDVISEKIEGRGRTYRLC